MTSSIVENQTPFLGRTLSSRASVLTRADGSSWWEAKHESTSSNDPTITTQILTAGPQKNDIVILLNH
jgi:hypothetical protein